MGILKVLLHVFHLAEGSITTQRALKMQEKHQLIHNFILASYLKGVPYARGPGWVDLYFDRSTDALMT